MIVLDHVSKRFGARRAVDDLCLTVRRGEIFGLLGHNGAGKSTAIGMMLGQVWPSGGAVMVCGENVATHRRQALQRVGAIFETPVFYDYLSGWQNLDILSHYTARTPPGRMREIIDWVGLTGREHDKVRKYSHGMRTRLALAQALLPDPELLILDEPSDGLDPEGIHEMRHTILRLHREMGLTIFLSSHLLNEVEQLCTRVAVITQGRKVFEGTLEQIRRSGNWVRIQVCDFAKATEHLRGAGLITEALDGRLILPASGTGTDQIVAALVRHNLRVFEIVREEQTLESFYLNLVGSKEERPLKSAAPPALPQPEP
jgi:ABC-2 type transport system ATP-binding protein